MADDPCEMGLTEVAALLASRQISSVELTRACLDRIDAWQPATNAFIAIEAETALRQAARRDEERRTAPEGLGLLHGVPMAHKDMFYRAGEVVSCGSKIRRDWVAAADATVLRRLDQAGAVTLGRLNLSEFAAHPLGANEHFGDCHTPWGQGRAAGGSSSGSGAAVAARMIFGSLGSDTGGSIRVPAALNGVSGFMPTYGRVSRFGTMGRSWSLDHIGPLARSAADCAAIFEAIDGPDPLDGSCLPTRPKGEARREAGLLGLKIGIPALPSEIVVDDAVLDAWHCTIAAMERAGARRVGISLPDLPLLFQLCEIIVKSEAATMHGAWFRERPQDYSPYMRSRIEAGFFVPATFYIEALSRRGKILADFVSSVFSVCDVVVIPTTTRTAPPHQADAIANTANLSGMASLTRPFNYLGLPSISIPSGFDASRLPTAIQLIGRPMADRIVLDVASSCQRETQWHLVSPALETRNSIA